MGPVHPGQFAEFWEVTRISLDALKVCRKWASSVQDNGRHLLSIVDPDGVDRRRRRRLQRRLYRGVGPNFTWHLDCYDKLNPYSICISGCIDGFSGKVIWLQAYHTSSKPGFTAGYFIESVVDEIVKCLTGRSTNQLKTIVKIRRRFTDVDCPRMHHLKHSETRYP